MKKIAILAALMIATAAFAQSPPSVQRNLRAQRRAAVQQQRIAQGVQSGQLTAAEAARLERKEARINQEITDMKSDGAFTRQERAKVERQQDRLSHQIYREKHDVQRQPPAIGPIERRDRAQQARIGHGIRTGQLTAAEAARLESQQARLQQREAHMRASGGKFTHGERNAIHHQQNQLSRRIYRQKHDRQHR